MGLHVYTRWEHGNQMVRLHSGGRVELVGVGLYRSWHALERELYRGRRDPRISFSRYFRLHRPEMVNEPGVLDLFGDRNLRTEGHRVSINETGVRSIWRRRVQSSSRSRRQNQSSPVLNVLNLFGSYEGLTIHGQGDVLPLTEWCQKVSVGHRDLPQGFSDFLSKTDLAPGIDLAKRGHEVRKLLFAGFGRRIISAGYDPEDVLQEIFRGLLARNIGKCRFDPSKSSFGHYVHMVIGCVLANYNRQQTRRTEHEQIGMLSVSNSKDDVMEMSDAALSAISDVVSTEHHVAEEVAKRSLVKWVCGAAGDAEVKDLAVSLIPLLRDGYTKAEAAKELGVAPVQVGKALMFLRGQARLWGDSEGVI